MDWHWLLIIVLAYAAVRLGWWRRRQYREARRMVEALRVADEPNAPTVEATDEPLASLAFAFERQRARWTDRLQGLTDQVYQHESLMTSMVEGVLAVDLDERVIRCNHAAAATLRIDAQRAVGRSIQEVIRHAGLLDVIGRAFEQDEPVISQIVVRGEKRDDRVVEVNGSALRDPEGRGLGALIVLHDVTRMRRLETVRRDFVANVSHELKTPVTAIKGFVETLLEDTELDAQQTKRFLEILQRQADRMHAIVEDLLMLARLEQHDASGESLIELEPAPLLPLVEDAVELCVSQAGEREIAIDVNVPPTLQAMLYPPLFEQAVTNLLDNAIKYSPLGSTVAIKAWQQGGDVLVSVQDQGPGISPEHLPRIFERFYRVDRARSREMGGTGLGLSIVKHIMQLHRGRVDVASELTRGSTFTLKVSAAAVGS